MITPELVLFCIIVAFLGMLLGWVFGTHDGYKMAQQDIRRLKRQMTGRKYQAGDIVEVWVPGEGTATVYATISRIYHLLDGDHDYQVLLPGDMHQDVDEEDIKRRITKGIA